MGLGRNTHAICAVVVTPNCVVAVSVAASRLLPGAPVVSSSTYVEFSLCTIGVAEFDGVGRGVPLMDGVPLRVPEAVPEEERVPESVPDGVNVGVAVEVKEDPDEAVGVPEGVEEGVGNTTPCTYTAVP